MLHPLARPVEIDEPAVVHDAVDERGGELVVAEHDAPFGELDVGGDHQSSMRWRSPLSKVASLRLDACHRPEPPPRGRCTGAPRPHRTRQVRRR